MHTERLYFSDAYLASFTAQVIARRERAGQHEVVLDQSAFYPEGGGQPADRGLLDEIAVTDVQIEDGIVWHTLAAPLASDSVHGEIDWARRLDHMQQHCGQHMLSAALERHYSLPTVAFHLGTEVVTIDIAGMIEPGQMAGAAALVNQVIWENRPVFARFVTPEQLQSIELRKPPTVAGSIRVVSIADFDHSACGGTHPHTTGGVGLLHIRRAERRGAQTRLEFLCGGRALRDYRRSDAMIQQLAAEFSCATNDVPAAVARLREGEQQARKRLEQAAHTLLQHEAAELVATAASIGRLRVVRQAFNGRAIEELRTLATILISLNSVALLGTTGEKTQLVFAAPASVAVDSSALLKQVLAAHGGRGGGQATLAQGALPHADQLATALDQAQAFLVAQSSD